MLRIALFSFAAMLMGGTTIELTGTNGNEKDDIADNNVSLAEQMSVVDGDTLAVTGAQPSKKDRRTKGPPAPPSIHPNDYDGWDHPARASHVSSAAVEKFGPQYRAHIDVHKYTSESIGLTAPEVKAKILAATNV